MHFREVYSNYSIKRNKLHNYINNIKKNAVRDIFTIINTTLIQNPYNTNFPKNFFFEEYVKKNKSLLFLKSLLRFYSRQFYFLLSYAISFIIYKIYYKKVELKINNHILIDVFFLIDRIIKDCSFKENYFGNLYNVLDKYKYNYVFLPRLYGTSKNPFKLIKFFKVINEEENLFLFEFGLLNFKDLILLFGMIVQYPFKTLRLLQKENSKVDVLFNNELIIDIGSIGFEAFNRYIIGRKISQMKVERIYSWSEFQVIERSFNFGVRSNNNKVKLYGCQLYINYETYFNTYVDDLDYEMLSSPHRVIVNGKHYILDREKIKYDLGVSLRYKKIFEFNGIEDAKNIILLGSFIEKDTKYMLNSVKKFNSIIFKNHPAVDMSKFGKIPKNITVSSDDIYKLFKRAKLVIGTATGTLVEAASCGISIIVLANKDDLIANPLVEYGKNKIWDIAFTEDEVESLYKKLMQYRKDNIDEINKIALWYRKNFFIEPIEKNIIKAFELKEIVG